MAQRTPRHLLAAVLLLVTACGSSSASTTAAGGGGSGGTGATLPCGSAHCDPSTQFCMLTYVPTGLADESCEPLPQGCVGQPTCGCFYPLDECLCSDAHGTAVTLSCMPGL